MTDLNLPALRERHLAGLLVLIELDRPMRGHKPDERFLALLSSAEAREEAERERDEARADHEAYTAIVLQAAGDLDRFDAAADNWLELVTVNRMVQAISSVFSKWAPEDVMVRFRDKVTAIVHLAFVEGAIVSGAAHRQAAEAALQASETRAQQAEARVEELNRALVDHNDLLRSAFTAAQRDAAHDVRGTTNYRTLADRAHEVLAKHHATTNVARQAIQQGADNG